MIPLTNAQIRAFKAQAQRLKATLKIGKNGISPQFLAALDDALGQHELVKVKFDDFKDQKKRTFPAIGGDERQPPGDSRRQCCRALPTKTDARTAEGVISASR